MSTNWWMGYVQGTNRGKVFIRVKNLGETITGDIVFKDVVVGASIIKLKGRLNNNQITAGLFDFVFARHLPLEPQTGQISMAISEDNSEISGTWATDIGSHGQCRLFKINLLKAFLVSVPFLYRRILVIKRGFMTNLKYLYLVFSLLVMIGSAMGFLKGKFSIAETIFLIIPLIFLFRNEIRDFFLITGLKKIGPVEFQEQTVAPAGINIREAISRLVDKYGNLFPSFIILNRFFVPRTKAILQMLAAHTSVTRQEFYNLAHTLGIEENNIQVTHDVLIQEKCIEIDQEGRIHVTEIGKRFLEFESIFNQFIPLG